MTQHNATGHGASEAVDFDPFAQGPDLVSTAPATEPQQEIWAAASLSREASCAYNESIEITLRGALDVPALQHALAALVERHESLRASFGPDGEELCISREIPLDFDVVDASTPGGLDKAREREVTVPFDLVNGPLFRCRLLRVAEHEHVLLFTAHHTICDGWSFGVLLTELGELYSDFHRGGDATLAPAPSYSDYANMRHEMPEAEMAAQDAWWAKHLEGASTELELPLDHARPKRLAFDADFVQHTIPAELIDRLKARGARRGCTGYTVVAGSMAAYLHRLVGKDDVILGVPAAGQAKEGLEGLVGHCVSLLPVRSRLYADETFEQHLDRFGEAMSDAWEHRDCSMGRIVPQLGLHRDTGGVPLVQLIFNVDRAIGQLPFEELDVEFRGIPRHYENFEMFINAVDTKAGLRFDCTFDATLFDRASVKARFSELQAFLERVADSDAPLSGIPIVTDEERDRLSSWNHGPARDWQPTTIDALVREQGERSPEAMAVRSGDASCDYATLTANATHIATGLMDAGVAPGDIVGVLLDRNAELPAALLGILETGAAYLPLDPEAPLERTQWMLEDAGVKHILNDSRAPLENAPALFNDFGGRVVDLATLLPSGQHETAPATGSARADLAATSPARSPNHAPTDIAYVIYTSGSTGKPKGVKVPHHTVANFLRAMQETLGVNNDDRFLALTTLSFDIAVLELWLPLMLGASTDIVPREIAREGDGLREHIEAVRPTIMQATPATWQLLLGAGWQGDRELTVLSGGEALPAPLARQLCAQNRRVWNLYGPTETTVWSTAHEVTPDDESVPIGRPIANTDVHVLDAARQPVPPGVPGELYIGGAGVTDGYLNRPELTAERFVENPFGEGKLYRTGDRVRFDREGRLEYLGRTDFQIKLRGHRIEPGEIEAALESHDAVERAVAVVRDVEGDPRLVAYMVLARDAKVGIGELRDHMKRRLPSYMLPQHFVDLDAMPLNASGKIDRKQLPSPTALPRRQAVPPSTDTEKRIAAIWQDVLSLDTISVDDNFFDLGGHSLSSMKVIARIHEQLGTRLRPRLLVLNTLREIANAVDRQAPAATTANARTGNERNARPAQGSRWKSVVNALLGKA